VSALLQGFVGMSGYKGRLEPVRAPPPFDEFRLLEESWRALRPVGEINLQGCFLAHYMREDHESRTEECCVPAVWTALLPVCGRWHTQRGRGWLHHSDHNHDIRVA
jgi:hypothetical protein